MKTENSAFLLYLCIIASVGTQSSESEKMSQKSHSLPSLESIKSLPVDFRLTGSLSLDQLEKSDDVNAKNSDAICSTIPENDSLGNGVVDGVPDINGNDVNEDSPYSGNIIAVEGRPSSGDGDLDIVTSVSPSPSISRSHTEQRWGDTASYAAKKVLYIIGIGSSFDHG